MMVQRWLRVVVFYYPAYLLATLLILAVPTLIWNYLTDHTVGSWQILRFGIFPNGARLTELLSSDPNTVLAVVFAQLAALWTISLRARRWSPIAAALLLCPAALIVLPYWVFLFREYRFDAAAGILLSFLTIWRAQGCLLDSVNLSFWRRFLEAWCPLTLGSLATVLLAFGVGAWQVAVAAAASPA